MRFHNSALPRRVPRQVRGLQRVETILSAAEQLFAESGFENATTNEIAARARVPIGSLYQFFPNRASILTALVDRYRDKLAAVIEHVSSSLIDAPLEVITDALVDTIYGMALDNRGFAATILNTNTNTTEGGQDGPIASAVNSLKDGMHERLALLIQRRAPKLSLDQCRLHATISHSAIRAHCALAYACAQRGKQDDGAALIREAKRMQIAYFTQVLSAQPS